MLLAITLLTVRIIDALMVHFNVKGNPYLEKSILKKRTTAVIPNGNGDLVAPGSQKIAIILLGAKSNHPFGFLAPEFMKTFKWLAEMNASFDKPDGPNGCKSLLPHPPCTLILLNVALVSPRPNKLAAQRRARRHGIRLPLLLARHRLHPRLRPRASAPPSMALVGKDHQSARFHWHQS